MCPFFTTRFFLFAQYERVITGVSPRRPNIGKVISGVVLITQRRQVSDKKWIKIYTVEEYLLRRVFLCALIGHITFYCYISK